jgi:hypothetical protein
MSLETEITSKLEEKTKRLNDQTIELATRVKEARELLEWHTNTVSNDWMAWMELSNQVMTDIRSARMAIGVESSKLLDECKQVRQFFMSPENEAGVKRLKDFVDLLEKLRSLKSDGTLDKLANILIKIS